MYNMSKVKILRHPGKHKLAYFIGDEVEIKDEAKVKAMVADGTCKVLEALTKGKPLSGQARTKDKSKK